MKDFSQLAKAEAIESAKKALEENNIKVIIAENKEQARQKAIELVPEGAEVMTASSVTLEQLGITKEINESGKYDAVKPKLMKMDRKTQAQEMQKLGAAPEYVIGSVHAVTTDGKVIIASNTGSQLPGYAYGASHVIWVVSTKKIVKDLEEGLKRIHDYTLPQEDARMKKIYGPQVASAVRKLLIVSSELNRDRITLIFVKEDLGF